MVHVSHISTRREPPYKPSINGFYEAYREVVINELCESFLPIYKEITEPFFNNSVIASVRRSYHYYDQEEGVFEYWIATHLNGEGFMTNCRVAVKVVDWCDPERLEEESRKLRQSIVSPMGFMDSELIFIVSPKPRKDKDGNLPRGFCHNSYRKFMTYFIRADDPLRAVRRILYLVAVFFKKRVKALGEKLNFPRWMIDWFINSMMKGRKLDVLFTLSQRLSLKVMTLLNNLLSLTIHFIQKFQKVSRKFGERQVLKDTLRQLRKLRIQVKGILSRKEIATSIGRLQQLILRKLNPKPKHNNNEGKEKSTFINKRKKVLYTNLHDDPYWRFRDQSDKLREREKRFLEWLEKRKNGHSSWKS
jgi:hypothetical protein